MAISIGPRPPPQKTDTASPNASRAEAGNIPNVQADAQSRLNMSIVQASLEVSISTKNQPLALLFRTAIDSLNQALQPDFGDNAIQNAASQDNTPEGTAGRIVSLSTGFFDAFKQNHPGEDPASVLKKFMDTIRGGFEKGFKEATDILQGLNVFSGDIAANVNKTYDLVQQGYKDFEAMQSAQISSPNSASQ